MVEDEGFRPDKFVAHEFFANVIRNTLSSKRVIEDLLAEAQAQAQVLEEHFSEEEDNSNDEDESDVGIKH